ncbi:hypothetical protein LSCM1_01854 [Leishmania martiniquensis]|uniref:Uncharacterized protein n=1 Tax=Leishmania martiniquensis TaxID=1580590 RepID=A0A836H5W9_9TRYP|nr:hypothetical protein LSCM1_01854 [Leishmania martiniquensis]
MPKSASAADHTRSQRPRWPWHGDSFGQAPSPPLSFTGGGATTHGLTRPLQHVGAYASSAARSTLRPAAIAVGNFAAGSASPARLRGRMSVSSLSSASSAPPVYTGAALLAGYTNRRRTVQKAAALSTSMRLLVQDVFQMEEEQRVLSQAFRGRQNLSQPQQNVPQQTAVERRGTSASDDARVSGEDAASSRARAHDGDSISAPESTVDSVLPGGAAAATLDDTKNATSSSDDGTGIVLESALDAKHYVQQQAQEKSDTLAKMRGMQQAIVELSEEAAVGMERDSVKSSYSTNAAEHDEGYATLAADGSGSVGTDDEVCRRPHLSVEVKTKLETIRALRLTLREMLDAHHAPLVAVYSMSGNSIRGNATSTALSGTMWLEQDANYRPPAPPHVFSTSAFAVALEYLSNGLACVARLADEVCVATTFRSRADPVLLLPHLDSLQKWMLQVERCLSMAQRHLRHFQLGEAAVFESGAYEVKCLREQALLLKEALTAQEQKLKAMEDAKVSALHRLREISRRCYLWEAYLLHREDAALSDAASRGWCPAEGVSGGAALAHKGADMGVVGPAVTDVSLSVSISLPIVNPSSSEMPFTAARPEEALSEAMVDSALPPSSAMQNLCRGGAQSMRGTDDAVSRPLSSSAQYTPAQPSLSICAGAHQLKAVSTEDLIEQRIARSWCNPYVRKQHRLHVVDQALMQQQRQRRQQQQSQSLERAGASAPAELESGGDMRTAEVARVPTMHPACYASLDSGCGYPSTPERADATARAGSATGSVSLARLGAQAPNAYSTSSADGTRMANRAAGSMTAAALTERVTDLADVRALQLLQSLLRSNPSPSCPFAHDHANEAGKPDTGDGLSKDTTVDPSLVQSPCVDATQNEERRAETWQSVQRLSRYLKTCTADVALPWRPTLDKSDPKTSSGEHLIIC